MTAEADARPALSAEHFPMVFDALIEAVFTIDREFVITSFNRTAQRVSGVPRAKALGRPCYELFGNSACACECPLGNVLRSARPVDAGRLAALNQQNDGTTTCVCLATLQDGQGRVVGAVQTFRRLATAAERCGVADVLGGRNDPQHGAVRRCNPDGPARPIDGQLPILAEFERRAIEDVLREHHWNRAVVCRVLGVSRTTLWRKMRKLGIQPQSP